ncbi:MAG: biotin--[acetyl-CoA-carboxylase] ligase [Saprospiraceae bacterium]|nr:biotin--[acetyl-CoA-carboxylase] ligase [Saprospiraceae bacterium]
MFDELQSTNEYAITLLSKSKPIEGTVISAHHQTAGKGQIGSSWLVEAGKNLTLSIILQPHFLPIPRQFLLNQAVSLAVVDFLRQFITTDIVRLKWPNDVYIGDKKSTGILIQNTISGTKIQNTVIGLGININQTKFPDSLPNPSSLALATGREDYELPELRQVLFACLEHRYLQLKAKQWTSLDQAYHKALYKLNEAHLFQSADGRFFKGTITGVTEQGLLKVDTDTGLQTFNLKEITFAKQ